MTHDDGDDLVRALMSGDPAAATTILARATTSTEPLVLTAAALLAADTARAPQARALLGRATATAVRPRDRQVAALAAAHLAGDHDRVSALAREHLLDHPDSVIAAWIAAGAPRTHQHHRHRTHPDRDHPGQPLAGDVMNRKTTAVLLIAAAVLTNAAFTVLGSIFDYPDVLKEPVADILAAFREHQGQVSFWFAVMAVSAALFAPIAIGVGRLSTHRTMRVAVPVGIAAAVVQVIGLSRWPLLVPGFAADATSSDAATVAQAHDSFETAHRVLGNLIGETMGYAFTAAWTLLVIVALHRQLAGRWFSVLGAVSAVLIRLGRAVPARPAGHRHRQLRRLRPVERLAGRLRRRAPASSAHRAAPTPPPPPSPRPGADRHDHHERHLRRHPHDPAGAARLAALDRRLRRLPAVRHRRDARGRPGRRPGGRGPRRPRHRRRARRRPGAGELATAAHRALGRRDRARHGRRPARSAPTPSTTARPWAGWSSWAP